MHYDVHYYSAKFAKLRILSNDAFALPISPIVSLLVRRDGAAAPLRLASMRFYSAATPLRLA